MKEIKLEPCLEQLLKEKLVSSIVEINELWINELSYQVTFFNSLSSFLGENEA